MKLSSVLIMILILSAVGMAAPPPDAGQNGNDTQLKFVDNEKYINANKILMFVTNHGNFGRDLAGVFGYDYGTFYPYFSIADIQSGLHNNGVLYAGGIWMGGLVGGQIRVATAEYIDEYVPGPMANGTYLPDSPAFKVYKLYSDSLAGNPNNDYLNWPVEQGAPINEGGTPFMLGDQMTWTVFNDANPGQHDNDAGFTAPLGVEVQMSVWAEDQAGDIEIPAINSLPVTGAGHSTVLVDVDVADPEALTGDSYMVVIDSVENYGAVWNLINTTTGQTLLANQTNFTGDESTPITDNFRVRVHLLDKIADWEWEGSYRPFTGVDWGGSLFFGGVGLQEEFWGSSTVADGEMVSVEVRWVPDGDGQAAYCYRRDLGFDYDGFHTNQNFEVWDISSEPPRHINFAFVEYYDPTDDDGQSADWLWNPGEQVNIDGTPNDMGGREYFFILNSDYTGTEDPFYAVNLGSNDFDILYAGWVRHRAYDGKPAPGDIWRFNYYGEFAGTPDTFTFVATPAANAYSGPEGMSIYMKYKLYNKGGNSIDDFYISLWTDPDLGQINNDLVGCDTLNDIFFCYNGEAHDDQFGLLSPAIGFKLIDGPIVPAVNDTANFDGSLMPGFKNLGMSSFNLYINGTDPDSYIETYNYMQGLDKDGLPLPNGTKFAAPGDPVTGTGDLDTPPFDKRMMASFGPLTFNPGDSQYVLIKMAVGQGPDRLSSITSLKNILNFSPELPPSELVAAIRPDPQYGLFLYGVDPIMDTIFITRQGPGPVGDIDYGSLVINGSISPMSVTLMPSHPGFSGEALALVIPAEDFILGYGLPWGVNEVEFTVDGQFADESPLALTGNTIIIGHKTGDANFDARVNVGDAVFLINYVFKGGDAPIMLEAGDANCDGAVNVGDVIRLINYIFKGADEPHCH